jgi:hypothetical protein
MSSARSNAEFERLRPRVLWAAALCLMIVQLLAFHGMRGDDAYITYRYGQNLASGLGLVFNPGQRVQGSTSPGHMLLSALVYRLFGLQRTPDVMAAIGCIAWCAQSVAVYGLLLAALGWFSAALIALAVGLGVAGASAFVPLETHLVAALVLFACAAAQRRRWYAAAVSCGFAVLMRPDALLPAGVLGLWCCRELRGRALGPLAVSSAVVLPWPVFATLYYGSPLPQTAIQKFQRTGFLEYFVHELAYPGRHMFWPAPQLWVTLLGLVMFGIGAAHLLRRDARLAPFVLYGVLHAAAYLVLRPFTLHTWHLYPWTLVFCVCVLSSVAPRFAPDSEAPAVLRYVQLLALVALVGTAAVSFGRECQTLDSGYWSGQRDVVYRRVAAYLRAHAAPDAWFASVEVGTIAYFSGRSGYDLGGLVTKGDDAIGTHAIRYIVVDKNYLTHAPPTPPVFSAQQGEFMAKVYAPVSP